MQCMQLAHDKYTWWGCDVMLRIAGIFVIESSVAHQTEREVGCLVGEFGRELKFKKLRVNIVSWRAFLRNEHPMYLSVPPKIGGGGGVITGFTQAHFQRGFGVRLVSLQLLFLLRCFFLHFITFILAAESLLLLFFRQVRTKILAAVPSYTN